MFQQKKLYRTEGSDATLLGVCGGLAEYIGVDPAIVRVITAVMVLAGGLSLWVYLLAAFIIPTKSTVYPGY